MTVTLHVPQLLYSALIVASLVYELVKHGEPKDGKHDFIVAALSMALQVAILWWGGFYR